MSTKIDIQRLDDIHSEMEKLNQEARSIITKSLGYNHIIAARSEAWHNSIKYSLTRTDQFQNTSLHDTLDAVQEAIEDGELEEDWGDE